MDKSLVHNESNLQKMTSDLVFNIKLSDGRYFVTSPNKDLTRNEYIIVIEGDPVFSNLIPALMRQKNIKIKLFSTVDGVYFTTAIQPIDNHLITQLIKDTSLNRFNILFGHITEEMPT